MKFRLFKDILVYILVPIFLFNATIINSVEIAFQISVSLTIIYSIYTRVKQNRLNTTGLILFALLIIYFLSNQSPDSDNIYFCNTCMLLSIGLIIP
ncbi:MAG: hypothetical protein PUJ51_18670, partial [Clostridiales bacterium]